MFLRPFSNFYNNLLIIFRTVKITTHNINIAGNLFIVRYYKGVVPTLKESAHNFIVSTGNDADDFTLRLFTIHVIIYARHNSIVVHCSVKCARRNEYVRLVTLIVGNDKAEAFTGQLQATGNKPHFFRQTVGSKTSLNNMPLFFQSKELVPKFGSTKFSGKRFQ